MSHMVVEGTFQAERTVCKDHEVGVHPGNMEEYKEDGVAGAE